MPLKIMDFINNYIIPKNPFTECSRSKEIQTSYDKHRMMLSQHKISVASYIMSTQLLDKEYSFNMNIFPYDFEEKVGHYLCWINPKYNDKYSIEYVLKVITNDIDRIKCDDGYNAFIIYENPIKSRSILEIKHYHIIFYNKID